MNSQNRDHLEKTYERILSVGFCMIPYEDLSDIIAPDAMVYGTAKDERIHSYEGIEALFKAQLEQIGDMKPSIDRKRITLRISNDGNQAIIVEEITLTLSSPEVTHTIFMRASCVMEYLDNRWKLTHWHTSTPVETENDPWHMEEWKREKEKLQQLVDEQTAALKQNNRELQIEAALERVRSRSLAMHHSSELSAVVDTLLQEFTNLEFTLTFCIINLIDEQDMSNTVWAANPETGKDPESYYMKFEDYPFHHAMWDAWKAQKKRFVYTLEGEEKKIYDEYLYSETEFQRFPKHVQKANKSLERYVAGFTFFNYSGLQTVSINPISEDELEILERFGRVFEQAYTRFLDLQKAEAQTREAQIETALEKVRSRTMAMQKGDELQEVAVLLYKELIALGVTNFVTCGYVEVNEAIQRQHTWVTSPGGDTMGLFHLPLTGDDTFDARYAAWKKQQTVFHQSVAGQIRSNHLEYAITTFNSKEAEKMVRNQFPDPTVFYCFNFSHGYLHLVGGSLLEKEEELLLARFTRVFEQTYTRFLDLKKAEEQAREAQIEVALEKVRSRTMGMRSSDELPEVANMLFLEVQALGINAWSCGYNILDEDHTSATCSMSSEGTLQTPFQLRLWGEASFDEMGEFINNDKDMLVQELGGEALVSHYTHMKSFPDLKPTFDELDRLGLSLPTYQINHLCKFSHGFLLFITYEKVPGAHDIFKRFTKVFDQTYTRFLDLQKAEARAREAQIQTALERVRSHSMGMQSTSDFANVTTEMFNQLRSFGEDLFATGIVFCDKHEGHVEQWHSIPGAGMLSPMIVPIDLDYIHQYRYDQWKAGNPLFSIKIPSDFIEQHFEDIFKLPSAQITIKDLESRNAPMPAPPSWEIDYGASFKHGYILVSSLKPIENMDILPRFAQVFEQAYIRFQDLQKAEAQAREAQIENALEKVRSRSLAMQSPYELIEVAQLLREEMGTLGVEALETSSIYIQNENQDTTHCWFTIKDKDHPDNSVSDQMTINLKETWVGREMEAFYRSSEKQTSIVMKGDHRKEWINYCERQSDLFSTTKFYGDTIPERTYHLYKFSDGFVGAASPGDISVESWDLLRRATTVFSFAYTRFRDLQIAEASARAALRQASLDRVRADISSMRNAQDLERITPLVFNELTTLGIPFIRCGVFIVHEKTKHVEVYLSSPEGKSLAVMNLPFGANDMTIQSVKAWKNKQVYIQHWDKSDFINWSKSLQEQGYVKDLNTYQGDKVAPESLHLHFIPFNQGLLYVGAGETLNDEQIDLVKALSKSFAIAYARYEDFVKLEKAKAEVEVAMNELKATQSQLIQSEKMASLGELTAGIAHEIQNPLNFVNNFSEVSVEMMQEVREEIDAIRAYRDKPIPDCALDEISTILDDIESNLGKINHHGKRADGIVKGMLQHSRSNSGTKEPTDINALCNEYLRLSYHGLRAKDKAFNATLITNFEDGLKKVNVIPQDLGRVVLNLLTNAFYAVNEKKQQNPTNYEPSVSIATKTIGKNLEITVKDNGNGMPQEVVDKIFQPFFTTKPAGQGTGLGLSMSYDIVSKGHGGELKVDTKQGEGTVFTIRLLKIQL